MTDDRQCVQTEKAEDLAEQLCGLLAEQVTRVRKGNMVQAERLASRVDAVLARMASNQGSQPVMPEPQRARLKRQHDELVLTLRAEQADVQTKLKQLRQVKRVVGAYNSKTRR